MSISEDWMDARDMKVWGGVCFQKGCFHACWCHISVMGSVGFSVLVGEGGIGASTS